MFTNQVTVCTGDQVILDLSGAFSSDWIFTFTRPDGQSYPGGTNGVDNDQILFPAQGVNLGVWTVH